MKRLIQFLDTLSERTWNPSGLRLFQITIYSWVLLSTLVLLPASRHFWSSEAFIPQYIAGEWRDVGIVNYLTHLLNTPALRDFYPIFVILQIFFLGLGILQIWPRISAILILFFTLNLDNKAWVTLDGGNNLIHIMLIYLVFADTRYQLATPAKSLLNNLVYAAARIQLVLVYVVAGLAKVTGELWQKGVALYYVLNTDEYTHPIAKALVAAHPYLINLGTYGTVAFQLCFPILIWNKQVRPYLLLAGAFLHLQISFVMGLFLFGLAMVACYTAFTEEKRAERILGSFRLSNLKLWRIKTKIITSRFF